MDNKKWYRMGKSFDISKDRMIEINTDIIDRFNDVKTYPDNVSIEKYIAETYKQPGETYIAGFQLCYQMIIRRTLDNKRMREVFWRWLFGIEQPNLFGDPLPIQLIKAITEGFDPNEGMKMALEDYNKHMEKKNPNPEVQ